MLQCVKRIDQKIRAEGRAEGRAEIILELLVLRFGPVADAVRARIGVATDTQLDDVTRRVLTAQTIEDALSPLC